MIYSKTKKKIIVFVMIFLIASLSIPRSALASNSSDLTCADCIKNNVIENVNGIENYNVWCIDNNKCIKQNENCKTKIDKYLLCPEIVDCFSCTFYGLTWCNDNNNNRCLYNDNENENCENKIINSLDCLSSSNTPSDKKSECEKCINNKKVWCIGQTSHCSSQCSQNEIKIKDKKKCEEADKTCTDHCYDHFLNLVSIGEYPIGICSEFQVNPYSYNPYSYNTYNYYNPVARTTRYLGRLGGTNDVGSRVGCSENENCYCYAIQANDMMMNILRGGYNPYTNSYYNPYTGTSYNQYYSFEPSPNIWDDPAEMKNPPKATQNPPEYICSSEADKVAHFNISSTLARIGDVVVISGQVNKTTKMAVGYKYTCRYQQVIGCDIDPHMLKIDIEYKECPSGTHIIYETGGSKKITNWGNIFQIFMFVAEMALMIYTAGAASGSFWKNLGKVLIGVNPDPEKIKMLEKIYMLSIANFGIQMAQAGRGQLPECYRVCAKEEKTDIVATNNPKMLCGGGYIIGAQKSSRQTIESTPDICGGISGLRVKIEIKDPYGRTIKQTTVTTDSNGKFKYTFNAPTKEGHYNALIAIV